MAGKSYVRLTFRPAGAKRNRTVWAQLGYEARRGDKASFWVVNREGERPEPQELIIAGLNEPTTTMKPAIMSRKYGMLMLASDPDLQNEVDSAINQELRLDKPAEAE